MKRAEIYPKVAAKWKADDDERWPPGTRRILPWMRRGAHLGNPFLPFDIATAFHISERVARFRLNEPVKAGLMTVKRGGRYGNFYTFVAERAK